MARNKFEFARSNVVFAGYRVDHEGYRPAAELVGAIKDFPTPKNLTDLRAFLGLANQFQQSSPELASKLEPLRGHLKVKTNEEFTANWCDELDDTIEEFKRYLTSRPVLEFFDLKRETKLVTDASRTGLGFVLLQKHANIWKIVQCGSRFLSRAEKNYSMVELECLGVSWAVLKCRLFLLGLDKFVIETDHRPLLSILNCQRLDEILNPRLRRLKQKIIGFNFEVRWVKGVNNCIADAFSRSPTRQPEAKDELGELEMDDHVKFYRVSRLKLDFVTVYDPDTFQIEESLQADCVPSMHLQDFKELAYQSGDYVQLLCYVQNGFPDTKDQLPESLLDFWKQKCNFSLHEGLIVFKQIRLVVTKDLVDHVLSKTHVAHLGIEKYTKYLRQFYWWPFLEKDAEKSVKQCVYCQDSLAANPQEPDMGFPETTRPMEEIFIDEAEIEGQRFLVQTCRHTNWIRCEEQLLGRATASNVKAKVSKFCFDYGYPNHIVSDQGRNFLGHDFRNWLKKWKIHHVKSSPQYPKGHAYAELAVKTAKKLLWAAKSGKKKVDMDKFNEMLLQYHNTPGKDGVSPAEKMFGRKLQDVGAMFLGCSEWFDTNDAEWLQRARDLRRKIKESQHIMSESRHNQLGELKPGEFVAMRNRIGGTMWRWNEYGQVVHYDKLTHKVYLVTVEGFLKIRNRVNVRRRERASIPEPARSALDKVRLPKSPVRPKSPPPTVDLDETFEKLTPAAWKGVQKQMRKRQVFVTDEPIKKPVAAKQQASKPRSEPRKVEKQPPRSTSARRPSPEPAKRSVETRSRSSAPRRRSPPRPPSPQAGSSGQPRRSPRHAGGADKSARKLSASPRARNKTRLRETSSSSDDDKVVKAPKISQLIRLAMELGRKEEREKMEKAERYQGSRKKK